MGCLCSHAEEHPVRNSHLHPSWNSQASILRQEGRYLVCGSADLWTSVWNKSFWDQASLRYGKDSWRAGVFFKVGEGDWRGQGIYWEVLAEITSQTMQYKRSFESWLYNDEVQWISSYSRLKLRWFYHLSILLFSQNAVLFCQLINFQIF